MPLSVEEATGLVMPGQRWQEEGGKHHGRRVEVLSVKEHSVTVRVLKSPGAKHYKSSDTGMRWTLKRELFGSLFRLIKESGGGSVHDAPLPPAALKVGMTIQENTQTAEPEIEPIEPNGNHVETNEAYLKVCSSCGQAKYAETGFYRESKSKDGYGFYCKDCSNSRRRLSAVRRQQKIAEGITVRGTPALTAEQRSAAARDGIRRKFEALTPERKSEIIALYQTDIPLPEVLRAYGINGAVMGMILDEAAVSPKVGGKPHGPKATTETSPPVAVEPDTTPTTEDFAWDAKSETASTEKQLGVGSVLDVKPIKKFTITYTVLRPVEVTEVVESPYMVQAINSVVARAGVLDVLSAIQNK